MRNALKYLFPFTALFVCLVGPSKAEAPSLAVCKNGACWISERDYKSLQGFVSKMREWAQRNEAADQANAEALDYAQRKAASCMSRLDGVKS